MARKSSSLPRSILVQDRAFACHVCQGATFYRRPVKLNTTGMTFLDLDWLNKSADGAICATCGYLHLFYGEMHAWSE